MVDLKVSFFKAFRRAVYSKKRDRLEEKERGLNKSPSLSSSRIKINLSPFLLIPHPDATAFRTGKL